MSSSSPFRFLPIKINEPSLIGLLASFALHSLLFAFPGIVLWKAPESKPRSSFTRVITLNSQEQKRLPQLFAKDIPEFPNTTIVSNPLLLDKPAPKPFNSSQPSPLPPPPPASTSLALPPINTSNRFKISTDITKPPLGNTILSQPLFLPPPASPAPPVSPQTPSSAAKTKPKPDTPQNQANTTNTGINSPNKPKRTFPRLPQPSTSSPPPIAIKPETANSDRETKLTPEEQKLVAAIRKTRQVRPQKEPKTTDEQANRNYVDWLVRVQKLETEQLNINGAYPQDACLKKLEGTNVYGVLVDTKGKAIQLKLIKSSGYRVFNEHGVEAIFARTFNNNTQQPQPYLVRVKFIYDSGVCSLPNASAEGNQNPRPTQKKPTPTPPPSPPLTQKKPTPILPSSPPLTQKKPTPTPAENNASPASGPSETTKKPARSLQDLIAPSNSNTPPHRTLPKNFEGIKAPSNLAPIIFRDRPKATQDAPEKVPDSESASEKN